MLYIENRITFTNDKVLRLYCTEKYKVKIGNKIQCSITEKKQKLLIDSKYYAKSD